MLSKQRLKINNLMFIVVLLISLFTLISNVNAQQGYTDISIAEAYNMINSPNQYPNLIILDVRTLEEYNSEHLYNSTHIPLSEIEARIEELEPYKDTEIIVYCRSGNRSRQASEILAANDFTKVFNMLGGISDWIEAGYPHWPNESETNGDNDVTIGFSLLAFIVGVIGIISIVTIFYKKYRVNFKHYEN